MRKASTTLLTICALILGSACSAEPAPSLAPHKHVKPAQDGPFNQTSQGSPVQAPAQTQEQPRATGYIRPPKPLNLLTDIVCTGIAQQGGLILCQTAPNALISQGRSHSRADSQGRVVIGFDRDAPQSVTLFVTHADGHKLSKAIYVAPRDYVEQKIEGLPRAKPEYNADEIKQIQSSSARKKQAFASNQQTLWFKDGFDYPIREFVKTSPFGSRRIINGVPKSPHYGVDIAAPTGTPIYAPADGVVAMADNDLYFEGAMVVLDHGQGLNSLYLHVSETFVSPGDIVKRGDKIAAVGSKGRSTGPHLCWRLKWKKENLDPELLTAWPQTQGNVIPH